MYLPRSLGRITEKEIQKEMDTLRKSASYQRSPNISIDQYESLLRKIALCNLEKINIITIAIYFLILFIIMISWLYFKNQPIQLSFVFTSITFLVIILGGIYTYQHLKLKKHKQNLFL